MSTSSAPWAGLAVTLYVRGFLLLAAAAIAIRWPEETLLGMTAVAGGVMAALGIFEHAMVIASKALARIRALVALHALLSVVFGAIAIAAARGIRYAPRPDQQLTLTSHIHGTAQ